MARLAPIYPGEGGAVGLCLAVNFLVVAGIMFGRNARDSLFLVYFGAQYLPYMYFANAVFLVLCSLVYTTMVDKIERGKFLASVSLIFVVTLVASRLVLPRPAHHWFYPVLYTEAQVIWYFSLMQFWTFAGDLFDTRQAKRLFPLVALGALTGMITVGVFSRRLVKTLGTANLLLVWAGCILVAVALGGVAYRRYRLVKEPGKLDAASVPLHGKPSEWQKIKEGFREVGREPLLRSMAGYVLLLWTVYAIVDFCFNTTMKAKYPKPDDLTAFFGRFTGLQGLLSLAVQLFFTRSVISFLGVGTTIDFHPGILVLGTAWMSLEYGFASVLSTKLGDAVMLYTFSDSSYQLLYSPITPERRARVRGFVEGYIRPLSLGAAGLLVLVGTRYLKTLHFASGREISVGQQLCWGAFAVAAGWLAIATTAKKGYIRALLRNLQGDSPSLRQAAANALGKLKDSASLSILAETLRSEVPERVVSAIQFLETLGTEDSAEAISTLLEHPDARVRATAASSLGRLARAESLDRLTPLLNDPDARVRSNVIEALASAKDPALVEKLQPLLHDPSTRARVNTVLTIVAIQGVSAALEWLPLIRDLAHGDLKSRSTATYALGRLPLEQSIDLLSDLLNDHEQSIRCEAAQALGRIGTPRIIPVLIEALAGSPELRRQARRSLVNIIKRHGAEHTRELMKTAINSNRPEIRSELADVLGRLKDPQVIETLIALLKDPEWRVRWKVLKSFERQARDGPLPEFARTALFDYAHNELKAFRQSMLYTKTLVPKPALEAERVLAQALEEDRVNIEERVFHMLGVLCGRETMLAIFQKLQSGQSRLRADALEALDNLAPKKIGQEVLALLEPPPPEKGAPATPAGPLLQALAHHPKPWLRACTAFYLGFRTQRDGRELLKGLLEDREGVVRETALYAGWQAFKDSWRPLVDAAAQSSDPVLRRCAQRVLSGQSDGRGDSGRAPQRGDPMLLTVEKVLYLKSAPVFAGLEGEELAALADIALEKEFNPGEIIFEEGDPAHHLYILVRGRVEVFRRVDSKERSLASLDQKECFGEMAILDDEPRSASVRAIEISLVLKIDRESFRELINERPQISFAIFKILTSRLRHQNLEAENLPRFEASHSMP